ncbi:MAG: sigma-70 family RNA polymerase sigma factor [Gammaproteobacteria bacterium]|nr:sigma-70 family RNA polymerase sigma factor [Gammaproteobacteria bacterium]
MALFGRTKHFREALEANWHRLYRVAYSWTHEPFIAHDLVQETIARALQHKDKITDLSALEIWSFKVMANCWRDHLRRRKDSFDITEVQLIDTNTPESHIEHTHLVTRVRDAIARLNQDQRQVITLISLQGFSYEEVARILDIPVGTVMSRVCRARQNLKQMLSDAEGGKHCSERIWRLK